MPRLSQTEMEEKESTWKYIATIAAAITAIAGTITAVKQCSNDGSATSQPKLEISNTFKQPEQTVTVNGQQIDKENLENQQQRMRQEIEELKQKLADKPIQDNSYQVAGEAAYANISGLWSDRFTGATYTFTQAGSNFTFQEHSNLYGAEYISAAGSGSVNGLNVLISYTTLMSTTGSGTLLLSLDNKTMAGTLTDNTYGTRVNVNLIR